MTARSSTTQAEPTAADPRTAMLRAALRLFTDNGYAATSMDAVAAAAGTNKREIYREFASKKDLFNEAVSFRCREWLRGAIEGLDPEAAPTVYLTNLGTRLIQLTLRPDAIALQRAVIGDLARHPKLGEWLHAASLGAAMDLLTPQLKLWDRQRRLRVADPRAAAEEFIESATGRFVIRAVLGVGEPPGRRQIARHLNGVIEFFLSAYA